MARCGGLAMTAGKRAFDIAFSLVLMAVLALPFGVLLLVLLVVQGRPIFYVSERMQSADRGFRLWKLRTMRNVLSDSGVSGGDKADRVTPIGRKLRRFRADEIPQLWNILKGDMSFVGPRPPLRQYVERFPGLYARVLQSRPGVTGLATLHFHRHEEWLLAQCRTAEETDQVYCTRCIPRKARLDLIYARQRNFCYDVLLMMQTVRKVAK